MGAGGMSILAYLIRAYFKNFTSGVSKNKQEYSKQELNLKTAIFGPSAHSKFVQNRRMMAFLGF